MQDLYIDTHSDFLNLAILKNGKIVIQKNIETINNHSKFTCYYISEMLKKSNTTIDEIDNIIVVVGPGSFTGTRVGVTIAKTICYLKKIDIIPIDYLYLQALDIDSNTNFITSVKDKKGCFIGQFSKDKEKLTDYCYIKNEEIDNLKEYSFYEERKNINIEKIYNKIKNKKVKNVFDVNPIYVKKINI